MGRSSQRPNGAAHANAKQQVTGRPSFRHARSLWENAWTEFVPFLDYSPKIRRVIYFTNPIESLHARFRRATRARGHFPNEQAAQKCSYLVARSLDPSGHGAERWMNRWKPALNALAVTFEGRLFPNRSMTTASTSYTVIPTVPWHQA